MGRLRITVIECNYKVIDRQLKEQYIHGLNDNKMLIEILCELTAIKETCVTGEQELVWVR